MLYYTLGAPYITAHVSSNTLFRGTRNRLENLEKILKKWKKNYPALPVGDFPRNESRVIEASQDWSLKQYVISGIPKQTDGNLIIWEQLKPTVAYQP